MKITYRELWNWINLKTPIRYRGEIYRADYNGLYYMLRPVVGNNVIKFYKISRCLYGLESNKK